MTITEGKRAIAEAVSANNGKGTRVSPCKSAGPIALQVQCPEGISPKGHVWRLWFQLIPKCPIGPLKAMNATGDEGTKGLNHLGFLCLHWTVVLRVTEAHYQWLLWCHPDQTIQIGQGIPDEVDSIKRRHAWKINLPIFKDEDAKDAVTYQSWRWDLTVYRHARWRDWTLFPYAIRSLQGYPGELVWSSSTDIILDDVLTILDEHYNNVKVLDALNQELFVMDGW